MGMVATVTGALCVWIVLWSINVKGFDAFMVFLAIVLIGATVRSLIPRLPGNQKPQGD